jgi:hypothetical protein
MTETTATLRGIPEIRAHFRTNQTPVYFISPTAFNLLGIDRWLRSFFYITYFDSFEGSHPRVFVPRERPYREFGSMEDICNYLLGHKEVLDRIERGGPGGKAVFVMFDDETEAFFLRVPAAGDYRYPGADLGVLVARSRMQTDDNRLTERALRWIDGIHGEFAGEPVAPAEEVPPTGALAFKTA